MRCAVLIGVAATLLLTTSASSGAVAPGTGCTTPRVSAAYAARVQRVLASGRDVWGERLFRAPDGPTLAAARRLLPPLLYAAGRGGARLTASGVYYLPFAMPVSVGGPRGFGLHVADGSEIIVRHVGGPSLSVGVGAGGRERFGSCLPRLQTPRLADGWLPVLQTAYRDATGTLYRQESFVGRVRRSRALASFVRVAADATHATAPSVIRLVTSTGATVRRRVSPGETAEVDAQLTHAGARLVSIDADAYDGARAAVVSFWQHSEAATPFYSVPEQSVMDAERGVLVQELEMTWRYSVGNTYEELSYAEALDVAQIMSTFGCGDVARQILRYTLRQLPVRFTNWRAGERLVAGAQYFRLVGDRRYVAEELPGLAAVVDRLGRQQAVGRGGLLARERYSSDIPDEIYSLQGQALVWEGLLAMSRVWGATGHPTLAGRARSIAMRLETGLRHAVRVSERRLPDGSLFVPAALLDGGAPFRQLTGSVAGTYWNLVTPYALASGLFAPRSAQAIGLLQYLELHGSRLLGLVRAGAYRLAAGDASISGTDQVYGVNVARFLADDDQPDQLVLSLYGTLAAALTPGTYVAGEAASVTPVRGELYRTMYLPPNNDGAAAFLETLRLILVHEARGPRGLPRGLDLAFATPRGWLAPGKAIVVRAAPTSFGPVGYSIARKGNVVRAVVDAPATLPTSLRLRLRLPVHERIVSVGIDDTPVAFDASTATITLPSRHGEISVTAVVASGS